MARFLLSKSKALEQYNSISSLGIVSYSFKTNPKVGMLLENNADCMFSVHFKNELKLIKDKSRVWYLAQALNEPLIAELLDAGVNRFVVENKEDLELLVAVVQTRKVKIELLLRIMLKENTIKTEKHYVFGMESDFVNEMIPLLEKNPLIEKLGVHFHRKTQNVSEWDLVREISELISPDSLKCLDYVNIGGGLPALYKNITDAVFPSIIKKIGLFRDWLAEFGIQLIIEPGRYLSGPCVKLESEIVGVHGNTVVIDASVYNSSPDTLIVPIKLLVEGERESGVPCILKGITPCSTDIFRYRVYLKELPKVGERIVFLNAGAYNFHTEFCELDKVETVIVD